MRTAVLALGIIAVAILTIFVVMNYSPVVQPQTSGGKISSPLGTELVVEDSGLLIGETTRLTLRAFIEEWAYREDSNTGYNRMPNVTMMFELPVNLEYVSGDLSWQGDIEGREIKELSVVVRAKEKGLFKISGSAISYQGSNYLGKRSFGQICIVESPEEVCAEQVFNETLVPSEYIGPSQPSGDYTQGGKKR